MLIDVSFSSYIFVIKYGPFGYRVYVFSKAELHTTRGRRLGLKGFQDLLVMVFVVACLLVQVQLVNKRFIDVYIHDYDCTLPEVLINPLFSPKKKAYC